MNKKLAHAPLSQTPSRIGPCRDCHHTRASHGLRASRCYSNRCACTGWLTPGSAP